MLVFIIWYLVISILGLLAFPLAYRLLPALADRGYAFSRTLGLLLWGFVFWLLSSMGVLNNNAGGLAIAVFALIALSGWALSGIRRSEIIAWFRSNRSTVIAIEVVFLLAFVFLTFVRASDPDITYTEKPMELAFINSIMRSPSMPPDDPWLSGFAISYYYFGYVMVAMLAKLTGVSAGVAFNLGVSIVFALTARVRPHRAWGVRDGIQFACLSARGSDEEHRVGFAWTIVRITGE
jgi:uncharacterized membrane protein